MWVRIPPSSDIFPRLCHILKTIVKNYRICKNLREKKSFFVCSFFRVGGWGIFFWVFGAIRTLFVRGSDPPLSRISGWCCLRESGYIIRPKLEPTTSACDGIIAISDTCLFYKHIYSKNRTKMLSEHLCCCCPKKSENLEKILKVGILLAPVCGGWEGEPPPPLGDFHIATLFYSDTEFEKWEKYCARYKKDRILHNFFLNKPDVMPVILRTKPVIGAWFIPVICNYLQSQLKIALFYGYPLGVYSQLVGHVEHIHQHHLRRFLQRF